MKLIIYFLFLLVFINISYANLPELTLKVYGGVAQLDNSSQININTIPDMSNTQAFTIEARVNPREYNQYAIKSTDISSVTSSNITDITGNMNGKFNGANAVGGTFNLESISTGSVNGVFGGKKVE